MTWHVLRNIHTKRFTVSLECQPDDYADLSWADSGIKAKIACGELQAYSFRVVVRLDGRYKIADTYLGESVYENPGDFAREHIGHGSTYFTDMVREAIGHARNQLNATPRMRQLQD